MTAAAFSTRRAFIHELRNANEYGAHTGGNTAAASSVVAAASADGLRRVHAEDGPVEAKSLPSLKPSRCWRSFAETMSTGSRSESMRKVVA